MCVAELRDKIHKYADAADDLQLHELYEFIQEVKSVDSNVLYDEETMKMLYERRENHLKGLTKSYTVEEAMNMIRQSRK